MNEELNKEITLEFSPQINEIASALAKAQGELKNVVKDNINPFFKSKYADLGSILDECREPLSKNGLAIIQMPCTKEGKANLVTLLTHSSGQWMRSCIEVKSTKDDIQGLGAGITYMRRYTLCAMVGITQEDDDAEGALDRRRKYEEAKKEIQKIEAIDNRKISKTEKNELIKTIQEFDEETQKKINAYIANVLKAPTYDDLTLPSMPVLYKKINITKEQLRADKSETNE